MKKILLSFVAFLLMALTAFAESTVFSWSAASDWTVVTDGLSREVAPYTVVMMKETGSTVPAINPSANDARTYAKGTVTVSTTGENMTTLVFNLSAQGKKRLAPITASVGEVNIDVTNWTVTWTGDAASVTFTVGEKADYGTDGNSKAGQFCFGNIEIYTNGDVPSGGETPEEPEVPNYTSLTDLKAAATADKVDVTYEFSDLLVVGVGVRGSNTSVYVSDGNAFLFYGAAATFQKGDRISGKIAGQLSLYNNAAQLIVTSYEGVSVSSSANAVEPQVVTIADLGNDAAFAYQSRYVQLQGVNFAAEALESSNITMVDDSDNQMTLRDNFNVLGDVIFKTDKTYNVSGVVVYYKNKAQLYALSASDVEMITNLVAPETAWAKEEVVVLPNGSQAVDNVLNTNSDGAKSFESSDPSVATVDAEGNITVVGKGVTVITATTAENGNYLESRASFTLYVIEGQGTFEDAYTPADVQYYNGRVTEKVWVKGEILGSIKDNTIYPAGDEKTQASNIAIGTTELYVPVQLPANSEVRTALNLKDNPSLQGALVWVYGDLTAYFSMPGVKNTSNFSLDGITGIIAVEQPATGKLTIYSLDGRQLNTLGKGIQIVNGKKVLVK
ncbi:MAG: DUF6359 domain-containing protein [Bacteroidales bacterium]|nr:DUF6359 domain-containing protein [Bacteroidales bacterium]